MCEFSGNLIAWMDGELLDGQAAKIEEHLAGCPECQEAVIAYREVSDGFLDCYAAEIARERPKVRYRAAASVAGVAAAIVLAFVLWPRSVERLALRQPPPPPAPATAFARPARQVARSLHGPRLKPVPRREWIVEAPTVEVALPAEALFPPGAVPPGFSFIADVRTQP